MKGHTDEKRLRVAHVQVQEAHHCDTLVDQRCYTPPLRYSPVLSSWSGKNLPEWDQIERMVVRSRTYSEETLHALASFRQVIVLYGGGDQLGLGIGVLCVSCISLPVIMLGGSDAPR